MGDLPATPASSVHLVVDIAALARLGQAAAAACVRAAGRLLLTCQPLQAPPSCEYFFADSRLSLRSANARWAEVCLRRERPPPPLSRARPRAAWAHA